MYDGDDVHFELEMLSVKNLRYSLWLRLCVCFSIIFPCLLLHTPE